MKGLFFFVGICLLFHTSTTFAEEKQHIVAKNDTFSKICQKYMEDGTKTTCEREAKRLGIANPHLIYPGQVFTFPAVYRLAWRSKITGYSSHGDWNIDKSTIAVWVKYGNTNFPELNHVIESK